MPGKVPTRVFVRGQPIPHTAYAPRVSQMSYANPGTRGFLSLSPESFKALEDLAAYAENVARHKMPLADNYIAMYCAALSGSYAQKYSAGMHRHPDDTTRSWRMPVPRVTEQYFRGWKVQKIRNGVWMLTNESREAYFIEYGIHRNPHTGEVSPRRIRRPIFKLSLLRTIEHLQTTAIAHRIWQDVLVPKPGEPGRRTTKLTWMSQPSGVMGTIPTIITYHAGAGGGFGRSGREVMSEMRATHKSIERHRRKVARQ